MHEMSGKFLSGPGFTLDIHRVLILIKPRRRHQMLFYLLPLIRVSHQKRMVKVIFT